MDTDDELSDASQDMPDAQHDGGLTESEKLCRAFQSVSHPAEDSDLSHISTQ